MDRAERKNIIIGLHDDCLTKLSVPPKQIWMMFSERYNIIWTRGKNNYEFKLSWVLDVACRNFDHCSLQDLGSLIVIELRTPALEARSLSHWITREFPLSKLSEANSRSPRRVPFLSTTHALWWYNWSQYPQRQMPGRGRQVTWSGVFSLVCVGRWGGTCSLVHGGLGGWYLCGAEWW